MLNRIIVRCGPLPCGRSRAVSSGPWYVNVSMFAGVPERPTFRAISPRIGRTRVRIYLLALAAITAVIAGFVLYDRHQQPLRSSDRHDAARTHGQPQTVLPFRGLDGPSGVAVDSAGSIYVTDYGNNRAVKLAAG